MVAEQCQVPEAADLTSPSKGSADQGSKILVEYTEQTVSGEMDPQVICVEHCNMNTDKTESCTNCNGNTENFEQHSASDGFFDQNITKCDTQGLSQPFDERAQHCECFKPCKSPEHCANHSLASKCSPCCEHCVGQLQLFHQCKPSDQQLESYDFEPDKLEVNCDSFGQCGMSDFIPECTNHLELVQQYEPCECSDSEPDTSTEDSEQSEMSGFTPNISDSADSLDSGTELSLYDKTQNQDVYTNDDDNDENDNDENDDDDDDDDDDNYENEQNAEDLTDEESPSLSEDTCVHVYLDDSVCAPFAGDVCETHLCTEIDSQQAATTDEYTDLSNLYGNEDSERSQEYEPTQQSATSDQCNSEASSVCCAEEDGSSDCSSGETKSFQTCPDGSIPSGPCSDSSGESEKGTQEDSSDEQMQWESFEEDEEIQQSKINGSNEDIKETPIVDAVTQDYFDLFDRGDYYVHMFAQKRRYISCFDGGDIHDHLYLEEEAQKQNAKNVHRSEEVHEEMNAQDTCECSEDTPEDNYEEDKSQRAESCDSEKQSGSSLAGDEIEEDESVTHENSEGVEDDDDALFDGEVYTFDNDISEDCDEQTELCLSPGSEESMFAPYAKEISVEGDAYEDELCDSQNSEVLGDATSPTDETEDANTDDKEEPEDKVFFACSEMEPYWSLLDIEENEEFCQPGIEEYYAYEIKSIQTSVKQALNEFIIEGRVYNQTISGKDDGDASRNKSKDDLLCQAEIGLQVAAVSPEESVRFEITEVIDLNSSVVENEQTAESGDECGLREISKARAIRPPSDIIHSVVSENAKIEGRDMLAEGTEDEEASEQSRDSEEEQSDDETYEACECQYCIPPTEQVPVQPLLPQLTSNDAGKICVVIDLDETLVHSSFQPVNNADFIIPVEIDGTVHQVYVLKRPHVDEFLKRMGEMFECVLFTASLSKYADPVSDLLDKWGAFQSRLFRESCVFHKGNYVKDLSHLGRDLNKVIIIDNSPASYIFHPDNAVPVASWFDDMSDTELLDLLPFFERLSKADDVYDILKEQRTSS